MHTKYTFGRSNWRTFEQGYEKEWLLTNGLGGFSCCTVTGDTARIHTGYLVASLKPPVNRVNVLSKIQEKVTCGKRTFDLACQEYSGDRTEGYKYLEQFRMDIVPTYCYQTDEISIEKTIAMEYGKNTVAVCYTVTGATQPVTLTLTPLFAMRPMDRVNSPSDIAAFRSSVFGRTMLVGRGDDSSFNAKFYISEGEYVDRSQFPTSMAAPTFIAEENQRLAIDARTGFRGLDTQYTPFDAVIKVYPGETYGLVGESGSGPHPPQSGEGYFFRPLHMGS